MVCALKYGQCGFLHMSLPGIQWKLQILLAALQRESWSTNYLVSLELILSLSCSLIVLM